MPTKGQRLTVDNLLNQEKPEDLQKILPYLKTAGMLAWVQGAKAKAAQAQSEGAATGPKSGTATDASESKSETSTDSASKSETPALVSGSDTDPDKIGSDPLDVLEKQLGAQLAALNPELRKGIEKIADLFKAHPKFETMLRQSQETVAQAHNLAAGVSGIAQAVRTGDLSTGIAAAQDLAPAISKAAQAAGVPANLLNTAALEGVLSGKPLANLLKANPALSQVLDQLLPLFTDSATAAERFRKFGDRFLDMANFVHRASPFMDKVPVLNWVLMLAGSIPAAIGSWYKYKEAKENPDCVAPNLMKSEAVLTMVAAVASIIAVPLVLAATGPVAAAAGASILTIYGLVLGARSARLLGVAVRDLYLEYRYHKDPTESYRERMLKKGLECLKQLADLAFYACTSLLAISGLVALFANPIGLGALSGAIGLISMVTMGTIVGAAILQKWADRKINTMDDVLKEINGLPFDNHTQMKKFKKLQASFKKVQTMTDKWRGVAADYREEGHKNPALFIMKNAQKHHNFFLKTIKQIGGKEYEAQAKAGLTLLQKIQRSPDTHIYRGIKILKETIGGDPLSLSITIPKTILNPETPAAPQATVQPHSSADAKTTTEASDYIKRFKDNQNHVKIHMNEDPSDQALHLMMQLNQTLGPLKMRACGKPEMVLKVLEAAKINNVDIQLATEDIALFDTALQATNTPEMQQMRDYFKVLKGLPDKQFQSYVAQTIKKKGNRVLGQIPSPSDIPKDWLPATPKPRTH